VRPVHRRSSFQVLRSVLWPSHFVFWPSHFVLWPSLEVLLSASLLLVRGLASFHHQEQQASKKLDNILLYLAKILFESIERFASDPWISSTLSHLPLKKSSYI